MLVYYRNYCTRGVAATLIASWPHGHVAAVVPPVTSVRELLKKSEVKTQAHSNVQLAAPYLPVSFQRLLPTKEKLYAPTLPAVL